MHPNAELIRRFYEAFSRRDGRAMAACYSPSATFSDPVFPHLKGVEVGGMWMMLCERGKDLAIEFRDIEATDAAGRAHWDATYTFLATGRKVHNSIDATFTFEAGLISSHVDRFDLWKWSRMALGLPGILLGWTPFVQKKIQRMAGAELRRALRSSAGE